MSKKFKRILGVVAAIAIPFAAPAIASAIGLSSAIGATAGSALVGAGLGATSAAVTGGDVGRGALLGGIGGGIGGYMSTPATPAAAATQVGTVGMSPLDAGMAQYPSTGVFGGTVATGAPVALSAANAGMSALDAGMGQYPSTGTFGGSVATGAPAGLSALDAGMAQYPSTGTFGGQVTSGVAPIPGIADIPQAAGLTLPAGAALPTAAAVAAPAAPTTFTQALKNRLTSPEGLADLTLRAAGLIAGSAIAGEGMSGEERALLDEQVRELRELQQTNRALFDQRLEQAQNLLGESRYFDPEYFGLQRARRVQMAAARMKRAGLQGLSGAAREAEARRFDIAAARESGTAFDQGYQTGLQGRLQTTQAGLQAMPSGLPSSAGAYSNLRSAYASAAQRARGTQEDIGELFGSLSQPRRG
jgi:hypothetical protein